MAITVLPDNTHDQIFHVVFEGMWTWDEFFRMYDEIDHILESRDVVDLIIDFRASSHMPTGLADSARAMAKGYSDGVRTLLFVGTAGVQRVAIEMYKRLFPKLGERHLMADSVEEAYALLVERQPQ